MLTEPHFAFLLKLKKEKEKLQIICPRRHGGSDGSIDSRSSDSSIQKTLLKKIKEKEGSIGKSA